ncbi:MAG: DUF481 domain-containing protein [Phycisphaeraceae bacterium]
MRIDPIAGAAAGAILLAITGPAALAQPADTTPATPADPTLAEPAEQGFFAEWESRLSAGFSGSEGDTRTQSFNASLRTRQRTDERRIELEARYFFSQARSERDQNEFRFEGTHDWLLPGSPWFLFARVEYDYNEFRAWEQRAAAFGGFGYAFVDREDLELLGRAGAGATYEFRGGRKWTPEALLGASIAKWNITEHQTLTGSLTYYPNLEEVKQYRLDASLEWTVDVNTAEGLSLTLGLANQYESNPLDGGERNNLNYYAALNLDF